MPWKHADPHTVDLHLDFAARSLTLQAQVGRQQLATDDVSALIGQGFGQGGRTVADIEASPFCRLTAYMATSAFSSSSCTDCPSSG